MLDKDISVESPETSLSLTDAAILMAADGYGSGKIIGKTKKAKIILETSETQKSFLFEPSPSPDDLYKISKSEFDDINDERNMKHL